METKKDYFYMLGKYAAAAQALGSVAKATAPKAMGNVQNTKSVGKMVSDNLTEQGVSNILPARSLGGATHSGIKQLYQSTAGKSVQWP